MRARRARPAEPPPRQRLFDLDSGALLDEARRRARLEDFASDVAFRNAFCALLQSYEAEANLKPTGRIAARQDILRLLTNRLRLVEDRLRRPEIAAQDIRRPLFLTGLPRTGARLLHCLFARDPANEDVNGNLHL